MAEPSSAEVPATPQVPAEVRPSLNMCFPGPPKYRTHYMQGPPPARGLEQADDLYEELDSALGDEGG